MRVRFDDLSCQSLQVLALLFAEPEPCLRWLCDGLRREQRARAEGKHIDPLESSGTDHEAITYHLRHAGAALEAFMLNVEEGGRGPYDEASNFLAQLCGQDLAMNFAGSGGRLQ
jgi:hypothetical protein